MQELVDFLKDIKILDLQKMLDEELSEEDKVPDKLPEIIVKFKEKVEYEFPGMLTFDSLALADALLKIMPQSLQVYEKSMLKKIELIIGIYQKYNASFGGHEFNLQQLYQLINSKLEEQQYTRNGIIPGFIEVLLEAKKENSKNHDVLIKLDEIISEISEWDESGVDRDKLNGVIEKLNLLYNAKDIRIEKIGCAKSHIRSYAEENKSYSKPIETIKDEITSVQETRKEAFEKQNPKIAFVDIDGTLIKHDGSINLELIEILKGYDEVVLFTQRSKYIQAANIVAQLTNLAPKESVPEFLTTGQVISALHAHGIRQVKVSTSVDAQFGSPTEYYKSELASFEEKAFKAGLAIKANPEDRSALNEVNELAGDEVKKMREALKGVLGPEKVEGRPDNFYPRDKIQQYRILRDHYSKIYPGMMEVSIFDDRVENLKEILDSDIIPQEQKPTVYLVSNDNIVMFESIEGLENKDCMLPCFALLIDFFLKIKNLNSQHDDRINIENDINSIVEKLLSLEDKDNFDNVLTNINQSLETLSKVQQLILPDNNVSLADMLNVIKGDVGPTKAARFIGTVRKEISQANKDSLKQSISDVRNLTLGDQYIAEHLNEAIEKLKIFVNFLKKTPVNEDNFESILEEYQKFTSLQQPLLGLGLKDTAPRFMQKAIESFLDTHTLDVMDYYRLASFSRILEYKGDQLLESGNVDEKERSYRFYVGANFYLEGNGRLLALMKVNFLRNAAEKAGVRGKKVDDFVEEHFGDRSLIDAMLMEKLVKEFKISEIPSQVALMFPDEKMRNRFNRQFYEYQIRNAYQIHQWQLDLHVPELPIKVQKAIDKFPKTPMEYLKQKDKSEYLNWEQLVATGKREENTILNSFLTGLEKEYSQNISILTPANVRSDIIKSDKELKQKINTADLPGFLIPKSVREIRPSC